MNIDEWVDSYKVRAFDWIDGRNIFLNVMEYAPGASLSKPPMVDVSVLIPKEQEPVMKEFLHTVVSGIASMSAKLNRMRQEVFEKTGERPLPVVSLSH